MPLRHYRTIGRRPLSGGKDTNRSSVKKGEQKASGEIPLSTVASFVVKNSLIVTAACYAVGYTKTVTLAWLFGTTLSVFRLPLEETIAQGGMAAVALILSLFQRVFGIAGGLVGILIVTGFALLIAAKNNYLKSPSKRPVFVLNINPRHKGFLNDWSGGSLRGMDLLISFSRLQFVALVPFVIGLLSAFVVYNSAAATSDNALPTIVIMKSGRAMSLKATLVGEDDDRVYAFRKGTLYTVSKSDVVAIKKADPEHSIKSLKALQHTGIFPRTD